MSRNVQCQQGALRFPAVLTPPQQAKYYRIVQQALERLQRWWLDIWVLLGEKYKNYIQRLQGRVQPKIVVDPTNVQQHFEVGCRV